MRSDNNQLLTEADLAAQGNSGAWMVWDERSNSLIGYQTNQSETAPALFGMFALRLADGTTVECRPALQMLKDAAARFAPELSESITTVPAEKVRKAVRLFANEKPSTYCTWVGLEQDNDAMQTNRAVCIFYGLTGQYDQRGSNVLFATTPTSSITGRELLPKDKAVLRLGREKHPLGPNADPGLVQAAEVYDAIITGQPYPIKAMVLFGTDPLLGHGDPLRGKAAIEALDFYVHVDTIINPSAMFADVILPAATCWEREALMPSFEMAEDTLNWAQLRPAVVKPLHESRSDTEIIFDLAKRLGLSEQFFNGDIDTALNYQLAPSGFSTEQLRANPVGRRSSAVTRHRKYAEINPTNGEWYGFNTPTGKIEIYSKTFSDAGYAPVPDFKIRDVIVDNREFSLTLTFFRDIHFCDEQHRNIPRLRRTVPEPFLEIHPSTASTQEIKDCDWIFLENATGRVKLKAKLNDSLHPNVVATVYGWWQACQELKLNGYDYFSENGANANLLIPNADVDPISASVAHRGQRCRVIKQ